MSILDTYASSFGIKIFHLNNCPASDLIYKYVQKKSGFVKFTDFLGRTFDFFLGLNIRSDTPEKN